MSITIMQAILITFFCTISNLMFPLLGDIGGYFGTGRPLIAGTIVGLILGDVKTGMLIGASLNAVYMSSQAVGNVMSTDVTMAGYIATALAMAGAKDVSVALALSIPVGLFGSVLFSFANGVCVFFMHKCDTYAAQGDSQKMWSVGIGIPFVIFNLLRIIPTFLVIYFGSQYSEALLSLMPEALNAAMGVVGGMLPAVGMALLLKVMVTGRSHWCFFLMGFLACALFGVSAVPLTIFAVCLAMIIDHTKGTPNANAGGGELEALQ